MRKKTDNPKMNNLNPFKKKLSPHIIIHAIIYYHIIIHAIIVIICQKSFLTTFIMRNDQKCWFWSFCPDNTRIYPIVNLSYCVKKSLRNSTNKEYTKFCWKILKLWQEWLIPVRMQHIKTQHISARFYESR